MKSAVIKRSIVVGGHKTSVSLEDPFWAGLFVLDYFRAHEDGRISSHDGHYAGP